MTDETKREENPEPMPTLFAPSPPIVDLTAPDPAAVDAASLCQRAMTAHLQSRGWSGKRAVPKAARDAAIANGANPRLLTSTVCLVFPEHLEPMQALVRQARAAHYALTLPWQDGGARILASHAFQTHQDTLRPILEDQFPPILADIAANYADWVEEARPELGMLWNPRWYPHASQIAAKFGLVCKYDGLTPDFRADLPADDAERIRAAKARDIEDLPRTVLHAAAERMAEVVGEMLESLTTYKPATTGHKAENVFRDTITANIEAVLATIPAVNVFSDPRIDALAERIRQELLQYRPATLRDSSYARQETRDAAQAIYDAMSQLVA